MPITTTNKWKLILLTTLIAGVLDLASASLQAWLTNSITPDQLLAYIASGIWGEAAYAGGLKIYFFGLLFHFIIVLCCVLCFFWIYPKWPFLHRSVALNAFLIGIAAWLVTTQVIVRLSNIPSTPAFQGVSTLIAIGILVLCIGFPIAYAAKKIKF